MTHKKENILGLMFDTLSLDDATKVTLGFLQDDKPSTIFTPNPEMLMVARKDHGFMQILNNASLVVPDGIGIVLASRLFGGKIKQRVAGYDLVMNIFSELKGQSTSIYFLGAYPEVAKKAKENMQKKYTNLNIVGESHGYFKFNTPQETQIINEIKSLSPDILLVGLGLARQEKWIEANKNILNCKILIGVGGSFDVMAQRLARAPKFMQKLGIEWLFRLILQPSRIFRQTALFRFAVIVLWQKLTRRK